MSTDKTGGPAFLHDRGGPFKNEWSGISVRDYFAAKAMQGMLADSNLNHGSEKFAEIAYAMADAMLKERAA